MINVWDSLATLWQSINILNFPSGSDGGSFLVVLFIIISLALGINRKGTSMIVSAVIFMTLFLVLGFNIPIILVALTVFAALAVGDDISDNVGGMFPKL